MMENGSFSANHDFRLLMPCRWEHSNNLCHLWLSGRVFLSRLVRLFIYYDLLIDVATHPTLITEVLAHTAGGSAPSLDLPRLGYFYACYVAYSLHCSSLWRQQG